MMIVPFFTQEMDDGLLFVGDWIHDIFQGEKVRDHVVCDVYVWVSGEEHLQEIELAFFDAEPYQGRDVWRPQTGVWKL